MAQSKSKEELVGSPPRSLTDGHAAVWRSNSCVSPALAKPHIGWRERPRDSWPESVWGTVLVGLPRHDFGACHPRGGDPDHFRTSLATSPPSASRSSGQTTVQKDVRPSDPPVSTREADTFFSPAGSCRYSEVSIRYARAYILYVDQSKLSARILAQASDVAAVG